LRAKTLLLKEHSRLSSPLVGPPIPSERQASLLPNQAIGFVASSQANFMRVVVEKPGPDPQNTNPDDGGMLDPRIGTDLLCVVRDLLKKIKRRVLVGDKVNDDLRVSALFQP
jgi:ribosome biogenesis GTPase / thiamine phosphate phosphatase